MIDFPSKEWKDLDKIVDRYLNTATAWPSSGDDFFLQTINQFVTLSTDRSVEPECVKKYAKSVKEYLEHKRMRAIFKAIYEKKEQEKRLRLVIERLNKENEITIRTLLARTSRQIASKTTVETDIGILSLFEI